MFHMQLECPDRRATLRNAIILALGGLLLAACAAPIQRANVTSVTVQPRDEGYVAVVQGEHPDACMQLGLTSQTVKDGKIEVGLLQAAPDPNAVCAQVITPFNEEVPLDVSGLTMGTYTVTVNGVAAELTLGAQPAALPATSPAASPRRLCSRLRSPRSRQPRGRLARAHGLRRAARPVPRDRRGDPERSGRRHHSQHQRQPACAGHDLRPGDDALQYRNPAGGAARCPAPTRCTSTTTRPR